jgi:hypothetical protein
LLTRSKSLGRIFHRIAPREKSLFKSVKPVVGPRMQLEGITFIDMHPLSMDERTALLHARFSAREVPISVESYDSSTSSMWTNPCSAERIHH